MAESMKRYTIRYERDGDGWWVATVRGVRGCHTQGRTIEEARRRIREALGLFVDDAGAAELRDDIRLPSPVRAALNRYHAVRARLEREQGAANEATQAAIRALRKGLRLSVRDAAALLGLSYQRVQQLSDAA